MKNEKVIEIIAKISGMNMEDIELDDELKILGINSLETVVLLLKLEETFEITFDISDLDIDDLGSVEAIIELIMLFCIGQIYAAGYIQRYLRKMISYQKG